MSHEPFPADPLRLALAEMRAELDALIEREIANVVARVGATGAPATSGAGAVTPRPRGQVSPGEGTEPGMIRAVRVSPEVRPAVPASREPSGRVDQADDVGNRLDALARRLEGRLNRPRSRAGGQRSATREGEAALDVESPDPRQS